MRMDQIIKQLENTKFQESEESKNTNPWLNKICRCEPKEGNGSSNCPIHKSGE